MRRLIGLCLVFFAALAVPAAAAVKPNPLISDGMVLQQGRTVPLWGTADPGEKVTVSFQGRDAETVAVGGAWTVRLDDLKAGGPYEMTIRGDNVVRLKDVYVGEVWLCAGQMNMDWPLHLARDADAVRDAKDSQLRLFQVRYADTPAPAAEAQGAWKECTPENAADFSAVAYFFGRDLRKKLGVPVGLIQATTSTGTADEWIPRPALADDAKTKEILQKYDDAEKDYTERVDRYVKEYEEEVRKAVAEGKDAPPSHPPENPFREWDRPAGLYNGLIAPLQPYALRGVAWYQGESDVSHPLAYEALLTEVVNSWRAAWKQADMPFLVVQLAPAGRPSLSEPPGDSAWAEVREAERLACRELPHAALVVAADAGEADDIEPPEKAPVGERLALAARAAVYGEKASYTGPVYESSKEETGDVVVRFTGASGGLAPHDGPVHGFTVAGDDGRFVRADAVIRGDAVVVSSPRVPHPLAVRYDWADCPAGDLADGAGLPASPFRTDDFPLPAEPPGPQAPTRPLTHGVPDGAMKVDVPGVQQRDDYSCGAAALMAVCSYYGVGPEELEEYKKKLGTNEENGTNVYRILKMARELGLEADIRHDMPLDELRKRLDEGAPVIVSLQAYGDPVTYYRDDNGHYVVVIGYDEGNFYFEDPVLPGRRGFLPVKEFDRRWHDDEGTAEKPDPHAHLGVAHSAEGGGAGDAASGAED